MTGVKELTEVSPRDVGRDEERGVAGIDRCTLDMRFGPFPRKRAACAAAVGCPITRKNSSMSEASLGMGV